MTQRWMFIQFDKKGAEWVVVAYLSGDKRMIEVCEGNESPHIITGALITKLPIEIVKEEAKLVGTQTSAELIRTLREPLKEKLSPAVFMFKNMSIRQGGKKSNHGLNYDEGANTFALTNDMEVAEAKRIIQLYKYQAYPGIPLWHEYTRQVMKKERCLINCFGRFMPFNGPLDYQAFKAGYAAIPQSTIVDLVNMAMRNSYNTHTKSFRLARLGGETHDSLTYSYPCGNLEDLGFAADFILQMCHKEEYLNPLMSYHQREFKVGTEIKIGWNWGGQTSSNPLGMREIKLCENSVDQRKELEREIEHAQNYFSEAPQ